MGHKKPECPRLTGRAVRKLAPITLRITDGREGRVEAPVGRSRAFQSQTDEIRVPSTDIIGM